MLSDEGEKVTLVRKINPALANVSSILYIRTNNENLNFSGISWVMVERSWNYYAWKHAGTIEICLGRLFYGWEIALGCLMAGTGGTGHIMHGMDFWGNYNQNCQSRDTINIILIIFKVEESILLEVLPDHLEKCNGQIADLVKLVRTDLQAGTRITIEALIVLDVHGNYNIIMFIFNFTTFFWQPEML